MLDNKYEKNYIDGSDDGSFVSIDKENEEFDMLDYDIDIALRELEEERESIKKWGKALLGSTIGIAGVSGYFGLNNAGFSNAVSNTSGFIGLAGIGYAVTSAIKGFKDFRSQKVLSKEEEKQIKEDLDKYGISEEDFNNFKKESSSPYLTVKHYKYLSYFGITSEEYKEMKNLGLYTRQFITLRDKGVTLEDHKRAAELKMSEKYYNYLENRETSVPARDYFVDHFIEEEIVGKEDIKSNIFTSLTFTGVTTAVGALTRDFASPKITIALVVLGASTVLSLEKTTRDFHNNYVLKKEYKKETGKIYTRTK